MTQRRDKGSFSYEVAPDRKSYKPGAAGAYTLTVHLHSGDFEAGGIAPSLAAPTRGSGRPQP